MRPLALLVAVVIGTVAMCSQPSAKASGLPEDSSPFIVGGTNLGNARHAEAVTVDVFVGSGDGGVVTAVYVPPAFLTDAIVFDSRAVALGAGNGTVTHAAILPESIICAPSLRWDCGTMLAIAWRESRMDNTAVNPYSGAACWFQIHPIHGYDSNVLTSDPWACTFAAYDLFLESEYRPWRIQ